MFRNNCAKKPLFSSRFFLFSHPFSYSSSYSRSHSSISMFYSLIPRMNFSSSKNNLLISPSLYIWTRTKVCLDRARGIFCCSLFQKQLLINGVAVFCILRTSSSYPSVKLILSMVFKLPFDYEPAKIHTYDSFIRLWLYLFRWRQAIIFTSNPDLVFRINQSNPLSFSISRSTSTPSSAWTSIKLI